MFFGQLPPNDNVTKSAMRSVSIPLDDYGIEISEIAAVVFDFSNQASPGGEQLVIAEVELTP